MKRLLIILYATIIPLALSAQQKKFSFDQLFQGEYPAVFNDLPQIKGWADPNNYIEVREQNGRQLTLTVNALTGKTITDTVSDDKKQEPVIPGAENVTLSPDGKYAAFTKKNNLFVKDIASGTEKALTSDSTLR